MKLALRLLLKKPGFTAVAILTLALGIGANTTVYSWVQGALIDVLPGVADQERLVVICPRHQTGQLWDTCSYPDLQDFAALTNLFSGVTGSQIGLANLRLQSGLEWIWAQPLSANGFKVLGLTPVLGRDFLPEEESPASAHPVAIISWGLWQGKFGGQTNIIGQTLEINQQSFSIVGVAPRGFQGTMSGLRLDLWVPVTMGRTLALGPEHFDQRNDRWLHTTARLANGVRLDQAQEALNTVARQMQIAYPDSNRQIGFQLFPLWKAPYGGQSAFRPLLQALGAMSAVVLLVVIANLSSLQLVRAADRTREIAVRLALGASRASIVKQLLTESVLLAALGGLGGLFLAHWATESLARFLPASYMPFGYQFKIDPTALGLVTLLVLFSGILFGLAPAWQATRLNHTEVLKETSRGCIGAAGRRRLSSAFVVAEVALALLLLTCAGLAFQSFQHARRMHPGLDPKHVLVIGCRLESHGHTEESGQAFVRSAARRLQEVPGVESVAAGDWLPLGFEGGSTGRLGVQGYVETPGENMNAGGSRVSADYFKTFRIPILHGREFRESDDRDSPAVAVVNEEVVKRFYGKRAAVGAKIRFWGTERTIVGVVRNGKYRTLGEPQQPFVYIPFAQSYRAHMGFAVRVSGEPYGFVPQLRAALKETDRTVEPFTILSMEDYMGAAYLITRIASTLLAVLSAVALFLAGLGIYGVTAYAVSQRTREIGIRMALGATLLDIYELIIRGGVQLALAGVVIGVLGSLAATRLMSGILLGVTATDPWTFVAVSGVLVVVALAACYLPARRAGKIAPMTALRYE